MIEIEKTPEGTVKRTLTKKDRGFLNKGHIPSTDPLRNDAKLAERQTFKGRVPIRDTIRRNGM